MMGASGCTDDMVSLHETETLSTATITDTSGNEDPTETAGTSGSGETAVTSGTSEHTGTSTSDTGDDHVCGNGVVEGDEECDADDLAGASCVSKGFYSGTLACDGGCPGDADS